MTVGEREVVLWEIMSGVGGTINFQLIVLTLFPPLLLWAIRVLLFGVFGIAVIDLHVAKPPFGVFKTSSCDNGIWNFLLDQLYLRTSRLHWMTALTCSRDLPEP
jgi:hypothetical protein